MKKYKKLIVSRTLGLKKETMVQLNMDQLQSVNGGYPSGQSLYCFGQAPEVDDLLHE